MPVRQHNQNNISDSLHKAGARIRLPVLFCSSFESVAELLVYFRSFLRNTKIPTAVDTMMISAEYPAILATAE